MLSGGRLLAVIGLVQACTALSGVGRAQGIIKLRLRGGGILQLAGDEDTAPNTGWVTERDPAKRKQLFNSVTRVNHKEEFQKRRAQGMPKKSRGPIWREVRDFACGAVVSVRTLPTSVETCDRLWLKFLYSLCRQGISFSIIRGC